MVPARRVEQELAVARKDAKSIICRGYQDPFTLGIEHRLIHGAAGRATGAPAGGLKVGTWPPKADQTIARRSQQGGAVGAEVDAA